MPIRHRSPGPASPVVPPPPPPLDVEQLRRFVVVARAGGFTAAARQLRIAQPAISRSISALEDDLGRKLIERTSRRFALTPLGEKLLTECLALFERVDAMRAVVTEQEVDVQGAVRLGASEQVATWLLSQAIATILARHPRLHPFVVVAPTTELASRVASGDLDLALTFNTPRAGALEHATIATFRYAVFVAAARSDDPRTCEVFLGSREVEDEREKSFPVFRAWRAKWPRARIRASTNSIAAHVALVRAGVGVSILPEFAVHEDLAAGRIVRAPSMPDFEFPLLVVRKRKRPSNASAVFLGIFEEGLRYAPGFVPRS